MLKRANPAQLPSTFRQVYSNMLQYITAAHLKIVKMNLIFLGTGAIEWDGVILKILVMGNGSYAKVGASLSTFASLG
jgi:hypothetical protein